MNNNIFKNRVIIFLLALLFNGCASKSWVIQKDSNGGVIGYRGFTTSEDANTSIKKLIHCPNFRMIKDELHSSQSTQLMPIPTSNVTNGTIYNNGPSINYQSTSTGTGYVPVLVDNSYRTFTYACEISNEIFENENQVIYRNFDIGLRPKKGIVNVQRVLIECDAGKKGRKILQNKFEIEQCYHPAHRHHF